MMMNKYGDGVCGCDGGGWCRWCSLRNAITTLRMSYATREHKGLDCPASLSLESSFVSSIPVSTWRELVERNYNVLPRETRTGTTREREGGTRV